MSELEVSGTGFLFDSNQALDVEEIADRVRKMRSSGPLSGDALGRLRKYFKIKNIYHSNAIEGNLLNVGETRLVVEQGLTLTGKPLKDQAEARNLSAALDLLEELATKQTQPIAEYEIRQIHQLVLAGIDGENAGAYRSVEVEISGSAYRPTRPEDVKQKMQSYSEWLSKVSVPTADYASSEGLIRAVAAHTWFVQIHPFIDGNGRVARLLMNLVLMRYGFPIAIITKEDRARYYDALETSQTSDLGPMIGLVCECLRESLEEYELAAEQQREHEEWARSVADRFAQPEKAAVENEYEVWKSAMDLLRGYFQQIARSIDQLSQIGRVYFKEFGILEFEKYLSLRHGESAKKTWFFRVDFRTDSTSARYLFFFGRVSFALRSQCQDVSVSLHVAREESPYRYERLDTLTAPNVPNLFEIAYIPAEETFVGRYRNNQIKRDKIENIGRAFIEELIRMHFSS